MRPKGITETSILMAITNAMGWAIIDWSKPHAATVFVVFTILIMGGYFVIWFYWKGRNWARILVLLTSLLSIHNLRYFVRSGITERVMIGVEAALAAFLLFWLNTRGVKAFFRRSSGSQAPIIPD
jgi:hypothetical protein